MGIETWDAPESGWSAVILGKRYRLTAFVSGSEAVTVYRAHDTQLDRSVVVNVLRSGHARDAQLVRRFRDAASTAAGLNHPNLASVFAVDVDVVNGAPWNYAVAELVEGPTLLQRLREVGRFPAEDAMHIALQLCGGISYAHKRGLVHGGIRPRSVLLGRDGRVKATDFGIAALFVGECDSYRAPDATATPATDVYALGALLYEMLTGRPPGADAVSERPSTANPTVSAGLDEVVMRALAVAPSERYRNADHLSAALLEQLQRRERQSASVEKPVTAPSVATPSVAERVRARRDGGAARRSASMPAPVIGETDAVTLQPVDRTAGLEARAEPLGFGVILLAVAALASVLGLIPLYVRVYVEYTRPPAPIVASPGAATTTPAVVIVASPSAGVSTTATPAPTAAPLVELPADLIGRPLDDALRAWFVERRLTLFELRAYSLTPDGIILDVEPDAVSVPEGSALTLTLSSGGVVPLGAQLGNAFVLDAARFTRDEYRPGMSVRFDVTWRALRTVGKDYRVFVHLHDAAGNFVSQTGDRAPADRGVPFPTAAWAAETVVFDSYELPIPLDAPPGVYEIRVGLYDDAGRLAVTSADAERVRGGGVVVGIIRVQ